MTAPGASAPTVRRALSGRHPAELGGLPNLGPKSAQYLAAAGIHSLETLAALGAVVAYARVKAVEPRASLNLLWALEGALTGLHWRDVAREHRTSLLLALESRERLGRGEGVGAEPDLAQEVKS